LAPIKTRVAIYYVCIRKYLTMEAKGLEIYRFIRLKLLKALKLD